MNGKEKAELLIKIVGKERLKQLIKEGRYKIIKL